MASPVERVNLVNDIVGKLVRDYSGSDINYILKGHGIKNESIPALEGLHPLDMTSSLKNLLSGVDDELLTKIAVDLGVRKEDLPF